MGTHWAKHHPQLFQQRWKREITDLSCGKSLNTVSATPLTQRTQHIHGKELCGSPDASKEAPVVGAAVPKAASKFGWSKLL